MNTATLGRFPTHLTFSLPAFDVPGDRRFGMAIAVSILIHAAWLGWLPSWSRTVHSPAPPLTVRLANPPLPPQHVPTVVPPSTFTPRIAEPRNTSVAQTPPNIPAQIIAVAPSPETVAAPTFSVPVAQKSVPSSIPLTAVTPAIEAPRPVPQQSPPPIDTGSLAGYGRDIASAVARYQRYPRIAQVRQWQGTALLRLSITAEGKLADIRVQTSSGHDVLDRQALDMVRESLPLPPLPTAFAGRSVSVDVPVVFRLAG